jgi:hypothetical protein
MSIAPPYKTGKTGKTGKGNDMGCATRPASSVGGHIIAGWAAV